LRIAEGRRSRGNIQYMVSSDGILAVSQNRKLLGFRRTKMEEYFWNFVVKHIAEEKLLSILFAGTGFFRFESISQNAAAENCKK
jgi:hypothetical protein